MTLDEKLAAATAKAETDFNRKASERFFTSPSANRYYVQNLADGSTILTLGGIGVVAFDGVEPIAISDVIQCVRVDRDFLVNLAKTINDLYSVEQGAR